MCVCVCVCVCCLEPVHPDLAHSRRLVCPGVLHTSTTIAFKYKYKSHGNHSLRHTLRHTLIRVLLRIESCIALNIAFGGGGPAND